MVRKMEALESRQLASPVHKNPNLEQFYGLCEKKAQVCMYVSSKWFGCLTLHVVYVAKCRVELGKEGLEKSSDDYAIG